MEGELILALDTATSAGSVALLEGEKILVEHYFDLGRQHSQRLFVEIEAVLKTAGCPFGDLGAVALSIGPGSFTGLRIGLSAAKGLCVAGDKALIAVSTLAALAARLPYAAHPVCAVLAARRREVYAALYDTASGRPRLVSPPRALAPERLLAERAGEETIYVGDAVEVYGPLLAACPRALAAPARCARPTAGAVGWLALAQLEAGQLADVETLEPEYVRHPQYRAAAPPPRNAEERQGKSTVEIPGE